MSNSLKYNSYHVLGLDTSASEKEILKRSKDIINRLKIDDYPDYDLDIAVFENFRTEDSVKDALQRLQVPKKRIKEYFFWLSILDNVDEQALNRLKNKDYLGAIRIWHEAAEGKTTKAYLYKKNLALLYCLLLSSKSDHSYLQASLDAWKEVVESEKFWASFSKIYKLHDEQTASQEILSDFKKEMVSYLADLYTELHELHEDAEYIHAFQTAFSVRGERTEKNILNPVYQKIHAAVEELEQLGISEDGKFDQNESESIRVGVATIQSELNKLIDLGLYEDSQTKIMRDRAANALRGIVLDLHNNLSELEKSMKLLEVAANIAGTDSLKNKLASELEQIRKNLNDDADNSLAIEIPGTFGGGTVVFRNSYLEYNNKKIFYKEATRISYQASSQSINFIPISQSFSFMVGSEKETISFTFGTTLHIGKKAKQDAWMKLIGISEALIEPHIVDKMVEEIFNDKDETISIGSVDFCEHGYSTTRSRIFGKGKEETIYWKDKVYVPEYSAGMVVLWKDNDGKSQQFATVPMSTPNAVVIPALVKACVNRAT